MTGSAKVDRAATVGANEPIFSRDFAALFACIIVAWSGAIFLYPILPAYVQSLGGGDVAVGVVGAAFGVASMVGRSLAGAVADALGRRRLLVGGMVAAVVAMILYEVTPSVPPLVLVRLLHGFAAAVVTTVGVVIATDLAPPKRRAESLGYYTTSGNFATAITPSLSLLLMDVTWLPLRSFPLVFAAGAVAYACATAITWFIPETGTKPPPASAGVEKTHLGKFFCPKAVVPGSTMFASTFVYGAILYFLPLAAANRGGNVALYFFVYGVTVIILRPLSGRFADRLGNTGVTVPSLIAILLSPVLLSIEPSGLMMIAAGVLLGIGMGGLWPSILGLVLNIVPVESRSPSIGTLYAGADAGLLVGSFVSGVVAEYVGYNVAFAVAAAVVVATTGGFLVYARSLKPMGAGG